MNALLQENNKQQSKTRFTSPKAVGRKSKTRISKSKQDISDVNKGEIITDTKPIVVPEPQPQMQLVQLQQQSLGKQCSEYTIAPFPETFNTQIGSVSLDEQRAYLC